MMNGAYQIIYLICSSNLGVFPNACPLGQFCHPTYLLSRPGIYRSFLQSISSPFAGVMRWPLLLSIVIQERADI